MLRWELKYINKILNKKWTSKLRGKLENMSSWYHKLNIEKEIILFYL